MCVIIYSPNGKIPKQHLRQGLRANPDGWGFMFVRDGRIIIRKGMSSRKFWAAWREEQPTGPVVWHARIGTQGTRSKKNCHPFPIPGHNLAMAHNGILRQHCDRESMVSDTQLFVWDVLARMPQQFLANDGIHSLLEHYAGAGKLVFLDSAGEITIINEHLGHWSHGRWHSNGSYLPVITSPPESKQSPLFGTAKPFWEVPKGGYLPR